MIGYKNYIMIGFFSIKALDIITIIIGVSLLNASELCIFGYNLFTLAIAPLLVAITTFLAFRLYPESRMLGYTIIFLLSIILIAVINNITEITKVVL